MKRDKFVKIMIVVLCIGLLILKPNIMDKIGKQKIYGLIEVPAIHGCNDTWEWMSELETFGALTVYYKEWYLRDDVLFIFLLFFDDSNNFSISTAVNLSESDKVIMYLGAEYDYKEKKLTYNPVYIVQGEADNKEKYADEKSIDECLNKYGLTRQDVKEYQEYAIYDVVVRTWTNAHITQWYWFESLKLKMCRVEDNTFHSED